MRSTRILAFGLSLLTVLVGSCRAPEPTAETWTLGDGLSPACPASDYLYSLPSWLAACPAIAGWNATPLFGAGAPAPLRGYCRYTWNGPALPSTQDVAVLANQLVVLTNSSNAPEADCPVVAPLGFAASPLIRGPLHTALRRQVSAIDSLPAGTDRVRVAVIDTAAKPFASLEEDKLAHGRAVGRLIDELGCSPGGYCAAEVHNHLGLPQLSEQLVDYENGGFYGTRGQLAQAIKDAVDAWAFDFAKSPKQASPRLILNLSVGWVPEYGGTDPGKMPLPARAVYDALVHAACYGALSIAAAGNDSGDSSVGPMLPGGWETVPAPTKCAGPYSALPTPYALWPTPGQPASLVTAVSAVDELDRPLSSTRPMGQSRLVAYGHNVVVPDTRADGYTQLLSGSSMSTAVAAAAAATVWSYRPDLTFDRVAELVYEKSVQLTPGAPTGSRVTEFCLGGTGCSDQPLRRVTVCGVAAAAAESAGVSVPKCDTLPAHAGSRVEWPEDLTTITPMPTSAPGSACVLESGAGTGCGTEGDTALLTPWVTPQPVPGCDVCTLRFSGLLYLDLTNPGYTYVRAITLLTYDPSYNLLGAQRIYSPTGETPYPEVFRVPVSVHPSTAAAQLRFDVAEGRQTYAVRETVRLY
ncbi:MAG: S8/S53 family peptidase [Polyangiaceae bacterium]